EDIKRSVSPTEILFVVDSMTGQDAVNTAKAFHDRLLFDGVVLTKLDGDARGGAALSVKAVTGKPVKFTGMGEKLDALEPFFPDRMASRILGMGDVMSLIEKAQETVNLEEAEKLAKKLKTNAFDLEDFRGQLKQVKKMGGLGSIMGMIPGMNKMKLPDADVNEKELTKVDAIISSMTLRERANHTIINGSRRARIARGSGTTVSDVNRLLKQYAQLKKMMKGLKQMEGRMGKMKGALPFFPR
ncbi:MAG TPA: signal recognition particle protein, partial [Methylomirabilota bacterium]|nr:signal recognition particle protein [Methylomirabilota bacterium]